MADLSQFSSSSHVTSAWLNESLRDKAEDEPLETHLAALAMKLHILSQDYTDQLETGMVEAMSTMPRVLAEISRLEETLRSVDGSMQDLASQIHAFDQRGVAGVEDLSRLDALKSNMEKCKATLEEHARWNQLVREAKAFLEGGGRLSDSADRIATMVWSLDVLQSMPGHDERRETCDKLSDLLLAALRPRVKRDIQSAADLPALKEYLYVYEKLGRMPELEGEYVSVKVEARLSGAWDGYSALGPTPLAAFVESFLAKVAQLLNEESGHVVALFGPERSAELLCDMLEGALAGCFGSALAERLYESGSPEATAQVHAAADAFAKKVLVLFKPLSAGAGTGAGAGSGRPTAERALAAIFSGLATHAAQHAADAEGAGLAARLAAATAAASFDAGDASADSAANSSSSSSSSGSRGAAGNDADALFPGVAVASSEDPVAACEAFAERLLAAADAVPAPAEAALGRATALLGGVHGKAALRALAVAVAGCAKGLAGRVEELRVACGLPLLQDGGAQSIASSSSSSSLSSSSASSSSASSSSSSSSSTSLALAEAWARRLELHDSGVSSGRSLIPCALRALQAAGRVCRHIRALEGSAAALLAEMSAVLAATAQAQSLEAALASGPALGLGAGASWALYQLHQDPSAASEQRSFLGSTASHLSPQGVLGAAGALARLKTASGALLFDLCLAPVDKMLGELHQEDAWAAASSALALDQLLPQQAVTQVGEHMLSLVQELELFASSDALPDLLPLSGEAQALTVASRGWRRLRVLLELKEGEGVDGLCRRASCGAAITVADKVLFGATQSLAADLDSASETSAGAAAAAAAAGAAAGADDEAAITAFVNEWLGAVADAAMGLLLSQLLQVKRLSPCGRAQLCVDLDYVGNVISAMGLRVHPLIAHARALASDRHDPRALRDAVEALPARSAVGLALQRFDGALVRAASD